MKVAVIAPVPLLERYGAITDYHLVLTHLVLRDNYYTQFYQRRKRKGDYLILDNSLIELGEAMSISDVLRAAELVQPDEIVLPDKFKDGPATLELIKQTLKELPKDLPYKLMAVPQGKDLHEWLECYNEILNLERIQVIGIPKVTQTYTIGRAGLTTLLSQKNIIDHGRDYHLLGVWENPFEIALQARHYWIRGVDTSIAVLCGQLGIAFDFQRGLLISRPEIKLDFYNASDPFPHITENNILCMLRWAQCK